MKKYTTVLTIAGSDSGGGAGIQADLKTFSALNCYGASVITALTAQNTQGVTGIYSVSPDFIRQQIRTVCDDIEIDAVKIGMLHNPEVIDAVASELKSYHLKKIVLDTVMVATSGDILLQKEAISVLKSALIPLATVITPNLPEAELLLGVTIQNREEMQKALPLFKKLATNAVLLKGGHLSDEVCTDLLYMVGQETVLTYQSPRIATQNTHGTGCTLSAAIAAELAKGQDLRNAVQSAHDYLHQAIKRGSEYPLGQGKGPVLHFWQTIDK